LGQIPSIHKQRLQKALAQLPFLPKTLRLVWQASSQWTTAWTGVLILQGLVPAATVYLTKSLVDSAIPVFKTNGDPAALRTAAIPAVLMAAALLLTAILNSVSQWIRTAQAELVQDHIAGLVHNQSIAADLAFYENPDFYDHLHRAQEEAGSRPVALLETLGSLVQNGTTLAAIAVVLIPFGPILPIALLASTLPALWIVLTFSARQHGWRLRTTADRRRADYYEWLLTSGDSAAEVRLFALGEEFRTRYHALRGRLRSERMSLARRQTVGELAAGVGALIVTALAMAWMAWRAITGVITVGDLALFYQAFQQGLQLMRTLLQNAGQVYANMLYLGNLFEFLALKPAVTSPVDPKPFPPIAEGIRFSAVRFHYVGNQRTALANFDLFVPAGKLVAIVGANGAGKSTLLKLLCRFYDPQEGSIAIDGIDLRHLSVDDLRRNITVLFQQPLHFNATAAENIALGDTAAHLDSSSITEAARAAGADTVIGRLPNGYDSLLGKRFDDGAELSGGEWQRIGLARAFARQSRIIILDEPTSSMDPWAEADWLARLRRLAAGRTAIVITHRFTTAMLTDEIHVMENGRIIQSGSHRELIASEGRYAQWWTAQEGRDEPV